MTFPIRKTGLSVLLLVVSVLLYGGAGDHTRLTDEDSLIWKNPAVGGGDLLRALQGQWQAGNVDQPRTMACNLGQPWENGEFRPQMRPVPTLLRAAEHAVYDYDRGNYQLDQTILHGIVAVLVFLLLARWFRSLLAGILGGLLFVAHPAASHTVLYLGGLSEILCATFVFGALLAVGGVETPLTRRRLWGIGLLAFLAMISKETGFILSLVVVGVLLSERADRARAARICVAVAAATVLAVLCRVVAIASVPDVIRRIPVVDPTSGLSWFPLLLQSIAGIAVEILVLLLPLRLSHDYSWLLILHGTPLYLLVATSVVLVIGAYLLAHRRGEAFPRTALVLLALLPLLLPALIPDLVGTPASERHLYLALPGWIGLLLLLGRWIGEKKESFVPVLYGVAAGIVLLLGIRTTFRVGDFESEERLLQAARQSYSRNPQVAFCLGNEKSARGDHEGAINLYEEALALRPFFPLASVNLASSYIGMEEWGLALRALDSIAGRSKHVRALRMIDAKSHYAAGRVLFEQDRNRDAALAFERVLLFYPENAGALGNLGLIYVKAPQYVDRGMEMLERVHARETDPSRRAILEKAMQGARERLQWYRREHGVSPSEREAPGEGAIGEPWKDAAKEGM